MFKAVDVTLLLAIIIAAGVIGHACRILVGKPGRERSVRRPDTDGMIIHGAIQTSPKYIVTYSTEGRRYLATLMSLLGNRGMFPWIRSPLLYCCVHGNQQ
jgi:hypothetical protein